MNVLIATALIAFGIMQARAESLDERVNKAIAPKNRELLQCWISAAHTYARRTCEPAETVVEAVFGKCVPFENSLGDVLVMVAPATKGAGQEAYLSGARESGRKIILATVLDDRASAGNCGHQAPQ